MLKRCQHFFLWVIYHEVHEVVNENLNRVYIYIMKSKYIHVNMIYTRHAEVYIFYFELRVKRYSSLYEYIYVQ